VGDGDAAYKYSGRLNLPSPWTPALASLRERLALEGFSVNAVLCNLYRDGRDSMGMHADDETELGPDPVVVSLSLGATRRFVLAARTRAEGRPRVDRLSFDLGHGSLLVMGAGTQRAYKHGVPKDVHCTQPRINLTFRQIVLDADRD
jgi:alkylated DNA repair dioxygenase AlkB